MTRALEGIRKVARYSTTVINISNQKLLAALPANATMTDAWKKGDEVLDKALESLKSINDPTGAIKRIDIKDSYKVLSKGGESVIGIGECEVEDENGQPVKDYILNAAEAAMDSELLENSIEGAQGLLFQFLGSEEDLSIAQVNQAGEYVEGQADEQVDVFWGASIKDLKNDKDKRVVRVVIVASGIQKGAATTTGADVLQHPTARRNSGSGPQTAKHRPPGATDDVDIPAFLRERGQ